MNDENFDIEEWLREMSTSTILTFALIGMVVCFSVVVIILTPI